jgi:putative ABC transport system permease protein
MTGPPKQPGGLRRRARRTMPAGEVLFIFKARLRSRVVLIQESLAVLGIAIGVALLFASQVASQSLDGSVSQLTHQLVGGTQYQLDARGPTGFPETLARPAGAIPGVRATLPLLDQQATIIGPKGRTSVDLLGVDPQFAKLGGPLARKFSGRQLSHQRVIALPKPLAETIGVESFQDAHLQTGSGAHETLVAATLGPGEAGGLLQSQIVLAPIGYAQRLVGSQGRISRLYIKLAPGSTPATLVALRRLAAANDLNFEPADFDAVLFSVASAPAQQGANLFSGISAVVGFLFAFNAMLLTVGERRRLIGMMRRQGTPRSMIVQALAFDALVIGAAASIIGLGLGELLSIELFRSQPGYLAFAFPVGQQRIVTAATFAEAIGAGLLAALVGVLAPLKDIIARPLRPSAQADRTPRGWTIARLAAGVSCLAASAAIVLFRPQSAVLAVVTLIIAAMALMPFLFSLIVLAFAALQRLTGSFPARLALAELKDPTTRVRSLAVAATGALAVFGSVAIAGAQHNLENGLRRTAKEWNHATEIWVTPAGENNTLATTPFPASTVEKVARLPAIGSATVYRGGFLNVGERRLWVIAPPSQSPAPMPAGQLTEGNVAVVNQRLRAGGWAVLSEAFAHELRLRIGQSFVLPAPRPTRFRLAGLSTNNGWPPGAVIINADDYARAWGSSAASALNIQIREGATPAQALTQVRQALGPNSGLTVQTASEREAQWTRISHQGFNRLTQISILVSIAAILAMGGVMSSLIWQRRERVAYLKRTGNRRGLLWRALFYESAVLLGSGCLIGATFGVFGQLVISHALATVTGFPISISVGVAIAIFSFLTICATALAIVAAPGYIVVRVRPTMVKPA